MNNWKILIQEEMAARNESLDDVISAIWGYEYPYYKYTKSKDFNEFLNREHSDSNVTEQFTIWTKNRVYFSLWDESYLEYVVSVPRNPSNEIVDL